MASVVPLELLVRQLQGIPGLTVSLTDESSTPFDSWARHWLETYKKGVVKDNSYYGTSRNAVEVHLIPYFGSRSLISITPQDIQEYFKTLKDTYTLETQQKIRHALYAIYETAIENQLCASNPVTKNLRLVSTKNSAPKRVWSEKEYEQAFKFALGHPSGLDIITLMETAISRSELLGLQWCDLDTEARAFNLRNGLVTQKSTSTGQYELVCDGLKNKVHIPRPIRWAV